MGNSHSHSHSRHTADTYDDAYDAWEEARAASEPGIELNHNTRNIRDAAQRRTLKKTVWVTNPRGPGTPPVRLNVPMGDLVAPLSLYKRAWAATTQADLDGIRAEMAEHERWAYGEYMGRVRKMAAEAEPDRRSPYAAAALVNGQGGFGISFLGGGGGTYLPPGVERYAPLRMPRIEESSEGPAGKV
ncbi:MAG: hypothetical protein LQ345_005835 [Seirophora villosa]|nr:MAG: hypothetical protein LQ345_005835 [Seirophora villosa]